VTRKESTLPEPQDQLHAFLEREAVYLFLKLVPQVVRHGSHGVSISSVRGGRKSLGSHGGVARVVLSRSGVDRLARSSASSREVGALTGPAGACRDPTRAARKAFYKMYSAFVAAFRSAAEKLKQGLPASFPAGSFPPALPFVTG
jgi:hypothetical protein